MTCFAQPDGHKGTKSDTWPGGNSQSEGSKAEPNT